MKREAQDFLIKELGSQGGSDETTRMYAITNVRTGITEVVLDKTVSQRFPVQELAEVYDLYERLTCGGGRRVYKPEDLASHN